MSGHTFSSEFYVDGIKVYRKGASSVPVNLARGAATAARTGATAARAGARAAKTAKIAANAAKASARSSRVGGSATRAGSRAAKAASRPMKHGSKNLKSFSKSLSQSHKEWSKPLKNGPSSWSKYIYTLGPLGKLLPAKLKTGLYILGKMFVFDFDKVGKTFRSLKRMYKFLRHGKKGVDDYVSALRSRLCPGGGACAGVDEMLKPSLFSFRNAITKSTRQTGRFRNPIDPRLNATTYNKYDMIGDLLDFTVRPLVTSGLPLLGMALAESDGESDVGAVLGNEMLYKFENPHLMWGGGILGMSGLLRSQMSRLLTTEESRMNYHSRTEELGFTPKEDFYIFAESNSAGLATRRMRLNDPFFRMLAMTDRTTVTEITEPLNDCQFDKNRSFQDPTHTNAYPYCTGFDRFYKGKVYTDSSEINKIKNDPLFDAVENRMKIPLFAIEGIATTNEFGFKTSASKVTALPDDRNNAIYKCVKDKPKSGTKFETYFPSKWLDTTFQNSLLHQWKYYNNHILQKGKGEETYEEKFTVPRNPKNYGKYFYGYDKRTMCDEQLQLLVLWGRQDPHLDSRFTNNQIFPLGKCYVEGNTEFSYKVNSELKYAENRSECGVCSSSPYKTQADCEHYGNQWTEYTWTPLIEDKCYVDVEGNTEFSYEMWDGFETKIIKAENENECGLCDKYPTVRTQDSSYAGEAKYIKTNTECVQNDGKWEKYTWRQTPNINDFQTCFEGCGGWCVKDVDKTNAVSVKTCDITNKTCSGSCSKACSISERDCKEDTDCTSNPDDECTDQDCTQEIASCSLF